MSDALALDPKVSAWVSASAGSGKTTLLTKRVLRLLLERPLRHILCLTYTKAAAAEMQNRIHQKLAAWAVAEEAALRDELFQDFYIKADKNLIQHAQRIFAHLLDAPQFVRVMTVHAYCQYVLHLFPFEAGLSPYFTLLEGAGQRDFQQKILARFLRRTAKNEGGRKNWKYFKRTE